MLLQENGRVLSRHPVKRRLFPHPSRDMVLLHLEDEGRFVEAAKAAGIGPCVLYAGDIEGRTVSGGGEVVVGAVLQDSHCCF